jgi:hypothetical protein
MSNLMISFFLTAGLTPSTSHSASVDFSKRVYVNQFPPGSEHLPMPRVVAFSVFMGDLKYPHMPLLLESMRWNPTVDFQMIHVVEEGSKAAEVSEKLVAASGVRVDNFKVKAVTIPELRTRVKERLGIDVPFTKDWFYKLCDYKPTLAHLFPELAPKDKYKFWGYVDMDVVWGNFSRFSHWFQGDYQLIISGMCALVDPSILLWLLLFQTTSQSKDLNSNFKTTQSEGWCGTTGAAAFFPLQNWSIR